MHYLKIVNIVSSINIPIYIGLIVFAPMAVHILYGHGYDDIIVLVRILSVYMIFRAIGNPVGSLVVATGRTDLEFIWNMLTLLVLPLFIFIGSQYSIIYVTISITFGMFVLFIPSWRVLIFKMTGASLKEYLGAIFKLKWDFITKN